MPRRSIGPRAVVRPKPLFAPSAAGRESLEDWQTVLRGLLERGLRGVLIVVQDDFSGLLPITQSLFLVTDVQLCVVHMQRNAKAHLKKPDAVEFQQRWRAIKSAWNLELAHQQFEELCDRFTKTSVRFIAELRKKRPHYLAFLNYPESIRRSFSTTNKRARSLSGTDSTEALDMTAFPEGFELCRRFSTLRTCLRRLGPKKT